jgi:hypothetical protein
MTKVDRTKLTDAVWNCIIELGDQGRITTHDVTVMVMERYEEVVEQASKRLAAEAIAGIARKLMKRPPDDGSGQISLFPADIQRLDLPHAISLPPQGADPAEEHSEDDYTWVEMKSATYSQLEMHITVLETSIERSQRRLLHLMQLRDTLAPVMAEERAEDAIYPVLEELGRLERALA